jgi:PQQ-like domain
MNTPDNDNSRTGVAVRETVLTPVSVSGPEFGKLFTRSVDGEIYTQPLHLPQMAILDKDTHNVVYVATMNNSVYAFDADHARTMEPL